MFVSPFFCSFSVFNQYGPSLHGIDLYCMCFGHPAPLTPKVVFANLKFSISEGKEGKIHGVQTDSVFFRFFLFRGRESPSPFRFLLELSLDSTWDVSSPFLTNNETKKPLVRSSLGEHRITPKAFDPRYSDSPRRSQLGSASCRCASSKFVC